MHSVFALAAPFALIMPILAGTEGPSAHDSVPALSSLQCDAEGLGKAPQVNPLSAYRRGSSVQQVRIEQRIVVRIAPRPPAARPDLLNDLPRRGVDLRFEEREKAKCVPIQNIAAVETGSGNRLVLIMRNRQMMSVNLKKSCRARDFYSGFYVEKNKDGRICVDRDRLQSRTGASCEVDTMRQLVKVSD